MVHGPTGTSLRRGTDCESLWLFKHTLTFLFACFTGDNISNCCGSFPIFLLQVPIRPSVLLSPFHIRGKSRTLSYGSPHGGWGGHAIQSKIYNGIFYMFPGQFLLVTWCSLGSIRQLLPGTAPNVSKCISADQEL